MEPSYNPNKYLNAVDETTMEGPFLAFIGVLICLLVVFGLVYKKCDSYLSGKAAKEARLRRLREKKSKYLDVLGDPQVLKRAVAEGKLAQGKVAQNREVRQAFEEHSIIPMEGIKLTES